tara:strand:- start:159 stop:353 length:195 start_codon:yes stop_codon:yes gene_type:complete
MSIRHLFKIKRILMKVILKQTVCPNNISRAPTAVVRCSLKEGRHYERIIIKLVSKKDSFNEKEY